MKCESFLILHRQQGYTIKAQKRSKDKLQEYFLCTKKPKIIVFNDFFSPGTVLCHYREYNDTYRVHSSACKQCAAHAFSTSAVSHACVVLSWTRVKDWEGEVVLLKLLFLFSLREKKTYSRRFIKLRLNHWCHMDYFNNVLTTFLCLEHVSCIAVYPESESSRISSKIS